MGGSAVRGPTVSTDPRGIGARVAPAPLPIPFVWANFIGNAAATGATLSKVGGIDNWDTGAQATRLLRSGDGGVEFLLTSASVNFEMLLGLSTAPADGSFGTVDWSWLVPFAAASGLQAFEHISGTIGPLLSAPVAGDRLRVAIEGGVVVYRRNGAITYTSTMTIAQAGGYPFYATAALYSHNGGVIGASLFGNWT